MPREREKMLSGGLYDAADPELVGMRLGARRLLARYNGSAPDDAAMRSAILDELLGEAGPGIVIEPPFYCDYGSNIRLGARVYFNFGCTVLDVCVVTIGEGSLLGPRVQILAATHPLSPEVRAQGLESGKAVTIGANVWIGGGAIILPGVTIGDGAVVGAGSVVTREVPARVLAVGNPCRTVRTL